MDPPRRPTSEAIAFRARGNRLEQHAEDGGGGTETDREDLAEARVEASLTTARPDCTGDPGPENDHEYLQADLIHGASGAEPGTIDPAYRTAA